MRQPLLRHFITIKNTHYVSNDGLYIAIATFTRIFETAKKENYDLLICERSLHTDKNVFCKMLYDEGKIDDLLSNIQ